MAEWASYRRRNITWLTMHLMNKASCSTDTREELNTAIRLPENLRSEDGRIFRIIEWSPTISNGGITNIKINVEVYIPIEEENSNE